MKEMQEKIAMKTWVMEKLVLMQLIKLLILQYRVSISRNCWLYYRVNRLKIDLERKNNNKS